jgi:hypothetical protein
MPVYFLLQVLQVKLAPFISEYCINCVYFTQNRNNNFFLQHKKTGSKRSGGTPIVRISCRLIRYLFVAIHLTIFPSVLLGHTQHIIKIIQISKPHSMTNFGKDNNRLKAWLVCNQGLKSAKMGELREIFHHFSFLLMVYRRIRRSIPLYTE